MIYVLIAAAILLIDRKIKTYIEHEKEMGQEENIFHERIIVTRYHNRGMFLNLLEGFSSVVIVASGILIGSLLTAFAVILPYKKNVILKLGLSFLTGGAMSNFADRMEKGFVVDYFIFQFKRPKWLMKMNKIVFNLGDIAVFIGGILVMIKIVFGKGKGV